MQEILKNKGKAMLLGNEAIVRGALESGVQFVSTYPGTPASEIGDTFSEISKFEIRNSKPKFYFEYSINEKVALEAAVGASFSGLKCLVAMKNFGLNVCSDALMPFCYTGTKGPTVIVVADDPSCHSSAQSEQNSRAFAYLAHIPILEPSDSQECKDFVKLGFQLSEKFKLPILIRITTRVSHQRMPVNLEKINAGGTVLVARFIRDQKRFVTMPPRVLEMKKELFEKIRELKKLAEKSSINIVLKSKIKNQKFGIVTSGVSFLYTMEALEELNISLPVLKLGFFYPLPKEKISKFIKNLKKVLVVEELEPYLEREIQRFAKEVNPKLQIFGKKYLPEVGELRPEYVTSALAKITGKAYLKPRPLPFKKIKHLPRFCVGSSCPYWKLFAAVKKALQQSSGQTAPKNVIFGGDIGCYMMAALPPHNLYDYLFCMGSSVGIAHGIKKALQQSSGQAKQKLIAFIGDSTFFHAGIPALINTVYNKSNPLIIILDNRITAMTGLQPNPGMGKTGMGEVVPEIKIDNIVRACGVKHLRVIDYEENFEEFVKTIKEFLNKDEVSVIVAKHICWLLARRRKKS